MTRGDRVRVNYGDVWPQCVCWPAGKTGTVLEVIGDKAIIRLDEFSNQNTTVELKDLEAITMAEVTQYPIDDTEYTTPAQAAEIRRMKAELPLWQEMESQREMTRAELEAQMNAQYPVPPEYYAAHDALDRGEIAGLKATFTMGQGWTFEVEQHRALNGTTGMESEE